MRPTHYSISGASWLLRHGVLKKRGMEVARLGCATPIPLTEPALLYWSSRCRRANSSSWSIRRKTVPAIAVGKSSRKVTARGSL